MSITTDYTMQMLEGSQWQTQMTRIENISGVGNPSSGLQPSALTDQINGILNEQISQAK